MAMAKFPESTILVRFGQLQLFSDISGVHFVEMDGSLKSREHLARRLKGCGCAVDMDDPGWQRAGDFDNLC